VTEPRFGASAPYTLGVEEELMLVDAASLDQMPAVARVLERAQAAGLKTELFASIVESNTDPLECAGDVEAALRSLRRAAGDAARAEGLALAAAGTHPFADPEQQAIVDEKRYTSFAGYGGVTVRRQGVQGLHVHVGMPSAETCWSCLELVLPWLPVVLALSANSPFLAGEETGLASSRAEVLAQLPRAGAPPVLASYAEWEAFVERFVRIGLADGYTRFWWDVRPHPLFGTLEVRAPDQPTDIALTGAFAALLQALSRIVLEQPPAGPYNRGDYAQNRWAALRFGPRAELIHPGGERLVRASELGAELLELVEPAARELGSIELLARIDPAACEGDRQLEVGRAESLEAVVADVAVRTLGSAA